MDTRGYYNVNYKTLFSSGSNTFTSGFTLPLEAYGTPLQLGLRMGSRGSPHLLRSVTAG